MTVTFLWYIYLGDEFTPKSFGNAMHDSEYSQWLNRTGTEVLIERLNDPQTREQAEADLWAKWGGPNGDTPL